MALYSPSAAECLGLKVPPNSFVHITVPISRRAPRLTGVRVLDLAWPDVKLCVQLDGWMWHSSREAFEEDRARDRALHKVGWMVLRWTSKQVESDPESLVAELVGIYQSRSASLQRKRGTDRRRLGARAWPTS